MAPRGKMGAGSPYLIRREEHHTGALGQAGKRLGAGLVFSGYTAPYYLHVYAMPNAWAPSIKGVKTGIILERVDVARGDREALSRALRDKRFDGTLKRAFADWQGPHRSTDRNHDCRLQAEVHRVQQQR